MPVVVDTREPHPFLPSLGDPAAIEQERALHQDIRPLEIAVINLMADKLTTERQLAQWLGATPLQVHLTFAATDVYVDGIRDGSRSRHNPSDHIRKFYKAFSAIKDRRFDGLIVTGTNALQETVAAEPIWDDVQEILDWSTTNVFSSLFLCWGAKAALRKFHGIESRRTGDSKMLGVYQHHMVSDITGLLSGLPDVFPVPIARWKSPDADAIKACRSLEVVAATAETGAEILVEPTPGTYGELYPRRVYVLNHPEYATDTLRSEYLRDVAGNPKVPLPLNYFPGNDVTRQPLNSWRHTATIYSNWVRAVYEATPYDFCTVKKINEVVDIAA